MKTELLNRFHGVVSFVAATFLAVAVFAGCTTPQIQPGDEAIQKKKVEIYNGVGKIGEAEILPVLFMADSQFSNEYAEPTFIGSNLADKAAESATRPPQLYIFLQDLHYKILREHSPDKYIIHLGDAINIGCRNEWDDFKLAMKSSESRPLQHKGWVMAPGNHDFLYFGNSLGSRFKFKLTVARAWMEACFDETYDPKNTDYTEDLIMTKPFFINEYLDILIEQGFEGFPTSKKELTEGCGEKVRISKRIRWKWKKVDALQQDCTWEAHDNNKGFLKKVAWRNIYPMDAGGLNRMISYLPFIVQQVDISPKGKGFKVKAIILDTTNYQSAPTYHGVGTWDYNGSESAVISKEQKDIVEGWISKDDKDTIYVFIGHHPFKELDNESKQKLNSLVALANQRGGAIYLSADEHERVLYEKYAQFHELNMNSMIDWPIEPLELGIYRGKDRDTFVPDYHKTGILELYPSAVSNLCSADKDYTDNDKYGYFSIFKRGGSAQATHDETLNTLLRTYSKMFHTLGVSEKTPDIPSSLENCPDARTDESQECRKNKHDLIKDMEKADRILINESQAYSKARLEYGACQAVWASKADWFKKSRNIFKRLGNKLGIN